MLSEFCFDRRLKVGDIIEIRSKKQPELTARLLLRFFWWKLFRGGRQ